MYIRVYIIGMQKYSIAKARSSLSVLVDQVAAGRPVELTRRGEPVAVLISRGDFDRLNGPRERFSDAYRRYLEHFVLADVGFDPPFTPARDRNPGRKVAL